MHDRQNFRFRAWVAAAVLLVGTAVPPNPAAASERAFRAGAATADLTPQKGVVLDGAISKPGSALGVHDPLQARAIVLALGETKVAFVVNDMCMIDREVYDRAKQLVLEKVGIPIENQLMSATHSHATPRVMRISTAPLDEKYRVFVAERIAESVIDAHENLAPARVGFASFEKPEMIACRRSLCEPGSVGVNPFGETGERVKSVAGSSNRVLGPAGPTDPQVSVLSLQHMAGRPLAVLANFSVHYCGGYERGQVSADYFGAFARHLQEKLASNEKGADHDRPPFVGMMSNGTSGDTGGVRLQNGKQPPWVNIDASGKLLAENTAELLSQIEHHTPQTLNVAWNELELSVRKPSAQRIAWAERLLAGKAGKSPHRWSRIYAEETLHLAKYPEQYAIPLQAIRIDDIGIAAIPCESFAETGLAIKAASPLPHTFVIGLANGYSGYLPTPQQHAWGGYETWPARTSHLEVQSEPKIRQEVLGLLERTVRQQ